MRQFEYMRQCTTGKAVDILRALYYPFSMVIISEGVRNLDCCKVEGCENKVFSGGYCAKHYKQIKRHGHLQEAYPSACQYKVEGEGGALVACGEKSHARGYCKKHYGMLRYKGEFVGLSQTLPRKEADICEGR